ncbi:hypothetical protein BEK98_16355 [Streptomyces diastatochromogenes]|uniref:Lipoprotein n=1 Tax=Streptomyces diastatochromogenes TaxID=42236 RepID=A0A233SJ89_STRDA|nr:hypothetical protein BEK98_16355 [Streptomyces diastatochromogenes]
MFKAVRGIAFGVVLMAALTACGSSDGGQGGGSDPKKTSPIVLDPDMVLRALISKAAAPKGWQGGGGDLFDSDKVTEVCRENTSSDCVGLSTVGRSTISPEDENLDSVEIRVYAFQSPDDAKVTMKAFVAHDRKYSVDGSKPPRISTDAEETEAFTLTDHTDVIMRVGGVVVSLRGPGGDRQPDYQTLAKVQIDRIKTAATGKNPDA